MTHKGSARVSSGVGAPEDIADATVWPCSEESRFVTGQAILVDGGFTTGGPR